MDTEQAVETGHSAVEQADEFVRQNPVPTVLGALAVGFLLGLLLRPASKPASRMEALREQLGDSESHLRSLLEGLSKQAKKKYKKGSSAVRESLDRAVEAVQDVDVDDYVDPASKWFKKLWHKYAS